MRTFLSLVLLAILIALPNLTQAALSNQQQTIDNSKNIYSCRVFEPNSNGGQFTHYRVTPLDQVVHHQLQDGVHYLEIHWWSWILNLSLRKNEVERELLGGASASHIKLRSSSPDLSVECQKE